jgi:hypothetical protein
VLTISVYSIQRADGTFCAARLLVTLEKAVACDVTVYPVATLTADHEDCCLAVHGAFDEHETGCRDDGMRE